MKTATLRLWNGVYYFLSLRVCACVCVFLTSPHHHDTYNTIFFSVDHQTSLYGSLCLTFFSLRSSLAWGFLGIQPSRNAANFSSPSPAGEACEVIKRSQEEAREARLIFTTASDILCWFLFTANILGSISPVVVPPVFLLILATIGGWGHRS